MAKVGILFQTGGGLTLSQVFVDIFQNQIYVCLVNVQRCDKRHTPNIVQFFLRLKWGLSTRGCQLFQRYLKCFKYVISLALFCFQLFWGWSEDKIVWTGTWKLQLENISENLRTPMAFYLINSSSSLSSSPTSSPWI